MTMNTPVNKDDRGILISVTNTIDATAVIEKLSKEDVIAVVFQKYCLTRTTPLDFILIGTEQSEVFLFDLKVLGDEVFSLGLIKELLENLNVRKIVFECPDSLDTLNHWHSVWMQNFLDVQLLEVMYRRKANEEASPLIERVRDLRSCIRSYLAKDIAKFSPVEGYRDETLIGNEVPHGTDTLSILSLFQLLKHGINLEFLAVASERYANRRRSYENLPRNRYINHPHLPSEILSQYSHTSYDVGKTCKSCQKMMVYDEDRMQQEAHELRCRTCRIVEINAPDRINVIKVNNIWDAKLAIEELMREDLLSVMFKYPFDHSLTKPFTDIFIATEDLKVYAFELGNDTGKGMFAAGLRTILEGTRRTKLMFNCKLTANTLYKFHNVWLDGVLDIQLLEVLHRNKNTTAMDSKARVLETNHLHNCFRIYLNPRHSEANYYDPQAIKNENAGRLPKSIVKMIFKAANLFALFYELKSGLNTKHLLQSSARFANYLRSYDNYPKRAHICQTLLLPLNILTESLGSKGALKEACAGCKKQFLLEDLECERNSNMNKKCAVCIELDKQHEEKSVKPNIIWLDNSIKVKDAIRDLLNENLVSVSFHRPTLHRSGELDVIMIGTEDCMVYVFDITTMGEVAFDCGLRELLESESLIKLIFDCRDDSDTLYHKHGTCLKHVLDIQVMVSLDFERNRHPNNNHGAAVYRLLGKIASLKKVPKTISLKCRASFSHCSRDTHIEKCDENEWSQRPLNDYLLTYWAATALNLFTMYEFWKKNVDIGKVFRISEKYLDYFRSYDVLPPDRYIYHSYLPHNILKESSSNSPAVLQCTGCRKGFPNETFNPHSIRMKTQKCPVCRKIDDEHRMNAPTTAINKNAVCVHAGC